MTTLSEITGTEILGGMPEACTTFYARWEYYNRGDAPLEAFEGAIVPSLRLDAPTVGGPHPEVGFSSVVREAGWGSIPTRGVEARRETYAGGVDPGVAFGQNTAVYRLFMANLPPGAASTPIPEIGVRVQGPGSCEEGS